MKQYLVRGAAIAAVAFCTLPAFAQKDKEEKVKDTKEGDLQTIVITRKGDAAEKTVIEITGDKVLINGKETSKTDDVKVNVHKIKTGDHGLVFNGNFNMDDDHFSFGGNGLSLFKEDSNRAMLGVETDVDENGARILKVSDESAAEKAGLKKGDVITKIDDKKINEETSIASVIRSKKPGDKIAVTFSREGKEQKLTAELGKWKGINITNITPSRVFGNTVRTPMVPDAAMPSPAAPRIYWGNTPRLGLSVQDTDEGKGVKVLEADEEGNAAKAGIEEDDIITHVNGAMVNSADEISKLMKENKDKPSVKMQVLRNGKTQTFEVRIPRKLKTANL